VTDARLKLLHYRVKARFGPDIANAYVKMNDTYENVSSLIASELKLEVEHALSDEEYEEIMLMVETFRKSSEV